MLIGIPPFNDETVDRVYDNILERRIDWDPFGDGDLSSVARDLITELLNMDPKRRLGSKNGSEEIKRHPFFRGKIVWICLIFKVLNGIMYGI